MQVALRLAGRTVGMTGENPAVGCVLVRTGADGPVVVGRGWTAVGGRPHAEVMALDRAGEAARGATAYVTLEPCAHHGRTPPCADALIAAGVERIVVAVDDPDPRVAGRGLAALRNAGVRVETGVCAAEARQVTAGFLSRIERNRPHVRLKLAVSADHRIAARAGERTTITGDDARALAHLMRARSDAILVGVTTAIVDDPELTCRLPGLERASPIRVVADTRLELPLSSRLVATASEHPVWVLAGKGGDPARRQALADRGVRITECAVGSDGRPDLAAALRLLASDGINWLLVEGGARIAAEIGRAHV